MKTIILFTTALVLSGSIFSVAQAGSSSDAPTAVVKFGDLDTTRSAGQEALYRRVTRAAQSVCGSLDPGVSGRNLALVSLHTACVDQALAAAVAQINRPEFTNYVATRLPNVTGADIRLAAR
jgi:UrcA family protein